MRQVTTFFLCIGLFFILCFFTSCATHKIGAQNCKPIFSKYWVCEKVARFDDGDDYLD